MAFRKYMTRSVQLNSVSVDYKILPVHRYITYVWTRSDMISLKKKSRTATTIHIVNKLPY